MFEQFAYPKVMKYFEEISAIPRGSYHEEAISAYLVAFARKRGLSYWQDEMGNVLMDLPATAGMEQKPPILLQGHMDMVCEKNADVAHDFRKEPLTLYEKDGWLHAEGTTLGADDGIAVALMLALADGLSACHVPLQCLFTVREEVGMDGAKALDYRKIKARKMLNLDSSDENSIIAGCAGGLRSEVRLPISWEPFAGEAVRLQVTGLAGGHSGEDIQKGRANANRILGRILRNLLREEKALRLVSLSGGSKDNAIPREAEAILAIPSMALHCKRLETLRDIIRTELNSEDQQVTVTWEVQKEPFDRMWDLDATRHAVSLLTTVPNGVLAMNSDFPKLVRASRNLGVVSMTEEGVSFIFSSRSDQECWLDRSAAELDSYAEQLGGTVRHGNRYPGWAFEPDSELRQTYQNIYRKLYGREVVVETIHAGLECGIIKQALPDMDMLSCGATILALHSPDEALNLASYERLITLILEILKQ